TPVSVLLEYLQHEPLLLVMEHQEVTGLVTPADLNSAAARSHFYLQFAALEIALSNLLRQLHPDQRAQDSAVSCLSQTRRDTYETLKRQLIAKDQYLDTFA